MLIVARPFFRCRSTALILICCVSVLVDGGSVVVVNARNIRVLCRVGCRTEAPTAIVLVSVTLRSIKRKGYASDAKRRAIEATSIGEVES